MDFGKMGELKKMYDKYKELQKALKNLVIRAKEGEFVDEKNEVVSLLIWRGKWKLGILKSMKLLF